jgi:hypothetical protein
MRLLRASGITPKAPPAGLDNDDASAEGLKKYGETLIDQWDNFTNYKHSWIETINLDRRKVDQGVMIDRLFSPQGIAIDILPWRQESNAIPVSDGGMIMKEPDRSDARVIAAVIAVEAERAADAPEPRRFVPPQGGWVIRFEWLGTRYVREPEGWSTPQPEPVYPLATAPDSSVRSIDVLRFGRESFPPDADTQALDALFLADRLVAERLGMQDIQRYSGYKSRLGPPLYGRHFVSIRPNSDIGVPVRIKISLMYLHNGENPVNTLK